MTDERPILDVQALGKDYGANVALRSLDCVVRPGEIVGLLGPNGSGKTTTMRLLLGLLRPTRGSARFEGLDCTAEARRVKERVGFMPDEPAFYDFLSGRETIDFVIGVRGLDPAATWARLAPIVQALEADEILGQTTGGYSHGTKKKLALLLALAHAPKLLLLDEPTNGLDPPTAVRVRALLRETARQGVSVIVSTHLLDMADQLCDRVLVLHRGALVAQGTTREVRVQAKVAEDASLEDAFLALVG
jgi:ABC-2 type transport system ATP-binding protein